ncbi:Crp/Fnr family transcriptional regulator [Desulfospira joergensenii]|uniref:Crp/Fnr family transcriptional regulator n=1 Tax=Desulfospira joergensenii TaxID=53329 RepID=UPI0003B5543D|nr:Crp/Fnr family transcriptional regulator [Desulfospira joergensenii]
MGMIMTKDQKKRLFQSYPVFSGMDPELAAGMLSRAGLTRLAAGTKIFDELNPCNGFPFVLSGTLRVFKRSVNGRELSLYKVSAGDVCVVTAGCLLGHAPYNASGLVKEDTELVMMTAQDFHQSLRTKAFREFVFSSISRRILELMQLVEEVAFQKLDRRLAALLIRQKNHLKVSHQELADELGTVREMITRLLNSFSDAGLIQLGREKIVILNESALQEVFEE